MAVEAVSADRPLRVALLMGLQQVIACAVVLAGYLSVADLAALPWAARLEVRASVLVHALLAVVPVVVLGLLARLVLGAARHRAVAALCAALCAAELVWLSLDRQLFLLTRLHLDTRMMQVLRQPDALSGIGFTSGHRTTVALWGLGAAVAAAAFAAIAVAVTRSPPGRLERAGRRGLAVAVAVLVIERAANAVVAPAFLTESNDPASLFPLGRYVGFHLSDEVIESLGFQGFYARRSHPRVEVVPLAGKTEYPRPGARKWAAPANEGPRPNIVVIAIESLRADTVNAETTPNIAALAKRAWVAQRHFSSANVTHLALFSLLSGLSPRVWSMFAEHRQQPFSYELLRRAGYELSVTSSEHPTWFGIQHTVLPPELSLGTYRTDMDRLAADDLVSYLSRPHEKPFFAFMFFGGSHFPYFVPEGGERFVPSAGEIRLDDAGLRGRRAEIVNRYRNSIHAVDALVGRVLAAVDEKTIVVITADHGESFWEDERFTHTSLLSQVQLQIPLIVALPSGERRLLDTLTRDIDVMPTVLGAAGIGLDPSTWSDGVDLRSDSSPRYGLAMQFDVEEPSDYALIEPRRITRFSLKGGALRPSGAEWLDGDKAAPPNPDDEVTWSRLLAVLRRATRWWPGSG